jgi:spoIIIJ-associated protein
VVSASLAPVREETMAIEPKKEVAVTKTNKPRRGHGRLGSRIKEKQRAALAPPVESPPVEKSTPGNEAPHMQRAYAEPMSSPRSERQARRPSSYSSSHASEEVVLSGIKAIQYAKPVGKVTDEGLDETLTELTDAMLARAGFPCRCETLPGEYRQVKVTTDDASAGMLIGRHGQTVDAVEHLVERMASNAIDARARINLDINNYRMHREESLVERVAESAAKVRETGRPVHLEPMSGRERRIVHLETEQIEGLRTFTMEGSGGKHVVIAMEDEAGQEVTPDVQPDGGEDWDNSAT